MTPVLDIDLLRTFAVLSDSLNFTQAGDRLGATQSAISVRVKKLEERIGRALFERTPRSVALTPFGADFLADARRILAVHDEALRRAAVKDAPMELAIGISEHAGGHHLTAALSAMRALAPRLRIRVQLGLSDTLIDEFDRGQLDAVIVRRNIAAEPGRGEDARERSGGGRMLFRDDLVWAAAPTLVLLPGEPVPLATIGAPCNARVAAVTALEAAGLPWTEVMSSRGLAAIQAAVAAGLGVGCFGLRHLPPGARTLGAADGLPPLPASEAVLFERGDRPAVSEVIARFAAAIRDAARG